MVRDCVEERAQTVVIDSLNGYQAAMPEEQALILHMHELLQYLNRQGATTFLTVAQHGLVGDMKSPGRRHLPGRHRDPAALFRGARAGCARDLGHQEAHRRARGHDPRISDRRATGSRSASRWSASRACCAAFRPIVGRGRRCWRAAYLTMTPTCPNRR
jgi:hypothetical protein